MAGAETTVERLRKFLRELSPGARSLLVGELERSVLRGDAVAGGDLVLQELRRIMREQRDGTARLDESAQLLFKPLEPSLVDYRGDHKHPGRVARTSLEALWSWVQRDLLPDDAESLAADVSEAMLAGDRAKTERLTRVFQDRVAAAIEASFSIAAEDGKVRRRILQQIGTPRAGDELAALKCALDSAAARDGELLLYALLTV